MRLAYPAVIACVAFAVSGCAQRDAIVNEQMGVASGAWTIERSTDRITNRPVSSAFTKTRKVASAALDNPLVIPEPAVLQLGCFKGAPLVRVGFDFKVGTTMNAELAYVFDQAKGQEPLARFVDNHRGAVIENPEDIARFSAQLTNARTLYVRIRSLNHGRTTAEFEVEGGSAAAKAAFADCPIEAALAQMAEPKKKGKPAPKTAARKPLPQVVADDDSDDMPPPASRYRTEEEAAYDQVKSWFRR